MTRLPKLPPGGLDDDQRVLYESIVSGPRSGGPFPLVDADGALTGPFNAMLFAPEIGRALQQLGAAVRYRTALGSRVRELSILAVAARWDCAFERYAHEPAARDAGATGEQLAATAALTLPPGLDETESAALRFVLALVREHDADDDLCREVLPFIGNRVAVELATLVGYYATLALQLRVFRVTVPAEQT